MDELPDDIYAQVTELSEQGNIAYEQDDPEKAIAFWKAGLKELPSPQLHWSAATWLYASIGDAQRSMGLLEDSLSSFQSAAAADGGAHSAFVQHGLGTALLDLDRKDEATDPLLRAYMLAGPDIFEDDDPKYLQHLMDQKLISNADLT